MPKTTRITRNSIALGIIIIHHVHVHILPRSMLKSAKILLKFEFKEYLRKEKNTIFEKSTIV